MTIYVDDMLREASVPNGAKTVTSRWSHLFTDLDDQTELHEFAQKLGLRRSWFQHEEQLERHPWLCHYDVTERVRSRAIRMGAVEVSYPWGTAELIKKRMLARDAKRAQQLARLRRPRSMS